MVSRLAYRSLAFCTSGPPGEQRLTLVEEQDDIQFLDMPEYPLEVLLGLTEVAFTTPGRSGR